MRGRLILVMLRLAALVTTSTPTIVTVALTAVARQIGATTADAA